MNKIRMYLIFWTGDARIQKIGAQVETAKTGDFYVRIAETTVENADYVDFEAAEKEFLTKCEAAKDLIEKLRELEGEFNIEIVPHFTPDKKPSIVLTKPFFEFVHSIIDKFKFLDIDMYIS